MSYPAILEYFQELIKIYFKTGRKEKTVLLDHAQKITGWGRKSILRRLSRIKKEETLNGKKGRCGARRKYPPDLLIPHIRYLWITMDRITPKRMKAALKDWLPYYKAAGFTKEVKFLLESMSPSTLARFIKSIRKTAIMHGLSSTSPSRFMKNKVPINTLDVLVTKPGYVQIDTVAHCGDRLIGAFVNSITFTDIYSTWTENRAIYTKRTSEVRNMLADLGKHVPFHLYHVNSDSGSEFLNQGVFNLYSFNGVKFTRSRAYKKNDNCYVEQKNFTHVRELFGYQRYDDQSLVKLMNEIYRDYWGPYQNFFLPTFKVVSKTRIGSKIKKIYDQPKTPYERLMDSPDLGPERKDDLQRRRETLNPFDLKNRLEEKLRKFFWIVEELKKIKGEG